MTPSAVRDARRTLAEQEYGQGAEPLTRTELGHMLRLTSRNPGATVTKWEEGDGLFGVAELALEALLTGWRADL